MDKRDLLAKIKVLQVSIGKLHAEACSHRLNKDPESMRLAHRQIERRQAEVNECKYILRWADVKGCDGDDCEEHRRLQ